MREALSNHIQEEEDRIRQGNVMKNRERRTAITKRRLMIKPENDEHREVSTRHKEKKKKIFRKD